MKIMMVMTIKAMRMTTIVMMMIKKRDRKFRSGFASAAPGFLPLIINHNDHLDDDHGDDDDYDDADDDDAPEFLALIINHDDGIDNENRL